MFLFWLTEVFVLFSITTFPSSEFNKIYASDDNCSYAGGIAGQNWGTIRYSDGKYNTIFSSANQWFSKAYSGGIVGWHTGNVSNCQTFQSNATSFAIGYNSSQAYSGGTTGWQNGNSTQCSTFQNCIKAATDGKNHSNAYAGGIDGIISGGNTTYCHSFQNTIVGLTNAAYNDSMGFAAGVAAELDNGATISNSSYYENNLHAKIIGDCTAKDKNGTVNSCVSSQFIVELLH